MSEELRAEVARLKAELRGHLYGFDDDARRAMNARHRKDSAQEPPWNVAGRPPTGREAAEWVAGLWELYEPHTQKGTAAQVARAYLAEHPGWTKEPKLAGWYWYQDDHSRMKHVWYVTVEGGMPRMNGVCCVELVEQCGARWYGPLQEPQ